MELLEQPLGKLARAIPGATRILYQYQLDFCCGGRQTLQEAATDRGHNPQTIAAQLAELQGSGGGNEWHNARPDSLIPHILERYHEKHRQQLPELIRLATRVELVHREHPDCPKGLAAHLGGIFQELESHMMKEEQVLFPMLLRQLYQPASGPIAMMRYEHDQHGMALQGIERLTNSLALPNDACDTWQALYWELDWFRADLMEHIHLENNVLFDTAQQLAGEHHHV